MKKVRINLILDAIDRLGMSQSAVAAQISISRQAMNAFINGHGNLSPKHRNALIDYLSLKYDDVVYEE